MTEQKIDTWSVTVNVNNEDVLTIGHSHVSGIADFDGVAPIIRTCAAHLLSFIGEGPDHVGNHIALSRAILQATTRDAPSADALHEFGITQDDCAAFARFYTTCEDGEGYDVPKEKMERLAYIGLVRKVRGTVYESTKFGLVMQDRLLAASAPKGDGND